MTEQHNIDSLFKSQLDAFESPVNPQVWSTVQAAMPQTVVTAVSTSATIFTAKALIVAASILVAATSAYFYFNDNTAENKNVVVNTEAIAVKETATQTVAPVGNNAITVAETINTEKESTVQSNISITEPIKGGSENQNSGVSSIHPDKELNPNVVVGSLINSNTPQKGNKPTVEPIDDSKSNLAAKPADEPQPADNKQPEPSNYEPIVLTEKWDAEELTSNIKINTDIITPNGDNMNDEFTIEVQNAKICNLIIYDRNGKAIMQYNTQTASWNGKLKNGNDAANGTYFFFIFGESLDGRPFDKKGNLTIKK